MAGGVLVSLGRSGRLHATLGALLAVVVGGEMLCKAAPPDAKTVAAVLSSPPPDKIPTPELAAAIRQAVANGIASIVARVLADGNDTGLAYPPFVGLSVVASRRFPPGG